MPTIFSCTINMSKHLGLMKSLTIVFSLPMLQESGTELPGGVGMCTWVQVCGGRGYDTPNVLPVSGKSLFYSVKSYVG